MPRKNRTYSDIDVIRIYTKHLNLEEKEKVEIYFAKLKTENVSTKIKEVIESIEMFLETVENLTTQKKIKVILITILKFLKFIKPFF